MFCCFLKEFSEKGLKKNYFILTNKQYIETFKAHRKQKYGIILIKT